MMKREIDWRQSSVRQILFALSQGLDANRQQFDNGRDVDDALEYEDDLCGIAFVTAQAYITGVVADVNALRGHALRGAHSPISKHELLKTANPIVSNTSFHHGAWRSSRVRYLDGRNLGAPNRIESLLGCGLS